MQKVAIVILNYLNFQDTIECVASIKRMNYEAAGIVIVDNGSDNESYSILRGRYKSNNKIYVVRANKNYGFAKGNNIGIRLAREKFDAEFVYVVNNDVIFTQPDYFEKLLAVYGENVGVIGSNILLGNGKMQNEYSAYVTFKEVINSYRYRWLKIRGEDYLASEIAPNDPRKKKKILHGCGLLFTPAFFKYYNGFYPRTFLYEEEVILYLMCERWDLLQKYVADAQIYHKEDQSSQLSFENDQGVKNKYCLQSYKYVIWWIVKNEICKCIKSKQKRGECKNEL